MKLLNGIKGMDYSPVLNGHSRADYRTKMHFLPAHITFALIHIDTSHYLKVTKGLASPSPHPSSHIIPPSTPLCPPPLKKIFRLRSEFAHLWLCVKFIILEINCVLRRRGNAASPPADKVKLRRSLLHSQICKHWHLVADCSTATLNLNSHYQTALLFSLFSDSALLPPSFYLFLSAFSFFFSNPLSSLSLSLICLSVCLSERRRMTTSPINSVAPPPSAVAPPLGNQGRQWATPLPRPTLPSKSRVDYELFPPSSMSLSLFLHFDHEAARKLLVETCGVKNKNHENKTKGGDLGLSSQTRFSDWRLVCGESWSLTLTDSQNGQFLVQIRKLNL